MFRQMEKLVELLNKHRREKVNKQSGITEWHYNTFTFSLDNISGQQAELLIISKQYGFIKRLVENEKIDTDIVYKKGFLAKTYDKDEVGEYFEPYEEILMLLAIQDNPIEFLVSILK